MAGIIEKRKVQERRLAWSGDAPRPTPKTRKDVQRELKRACPLNAVRLFGVQLGRHCKNLFFWPRLVSCVVYGVSICPHGDDKYMGFLTEHLFLLSSSIILEMLRLKSSTIKS